MLRAIHFDTPEYIPMNFAINGSCWLAYPHDEIYDLMESHPILFPNFKRPSKAVCPVFHPICQKDMPYTDDFGCVWRTTMDGITGTVVEHPLGDWGKFESYKAPDPSTCTGIGAINWEQQKQNIALAKERGDFTSGGLRHGHTFLQLCDLRGYENLMFDFADNKAEIFKLIDMVEQFNAYIVKQYVEMGVDMVSYAEDLGMQLGPMLSPAHFKKYIKPSYQRLMKPAVEKGCIIHMHSDGDIRTLTDDLIDSQVQVLNLQDLVNGVDWIADTFGGRICVEVDIDRQHITSQGTPQQIDSLIREEVIKIGSKQGGLLMIYGWYPGVPLENVRALMDAMEKYSFYY